MKQAGLTETTTLDTDQIDLVRLALEAWLEHHGEPAAAKLGRDYGAYVAQMDGGMLVEACATALISMCPAPAMADTSDAPTTPAEYRNGIRNLMIDCLSIKWAKPNIMVPYGGLNDIPEDMLPALYAKAVADADAMGPDV